MTQLPPAGQPGAIWLFAVAYCQRCRVDSYMWLLFSKDFRQRLAPCWNGVEVYEDGTVSVPPHQLGYFPLALPDPQLESPIQPHEPDPPSTGSTLSS